MRIDLDNEALDAINRAVNRTSQDPLLADVALSHIVAAMDRAELTWTEFDDSLVVANHPGTCGCIICEDMGSGV